MKIDISVGSCKPSWSSNPCAPAKPKPPCASKPKGPCKDACKPNKSVTIGFGVMPMGMIAFGGFGLGKFF